MGEFPNKLQQWEKGKSGNPNGRPKGSKNRATIMNSGYGQPKQEITNEQKTELIIQPVNEEVRKAIEDN